MGKKKRLSFVERAEINYTRNRRLLEKVDVRKTAVRNAVVKFRNEPPLQAKETIGLPRKTSIRDDKG